MQGARCLSAEPRLLCRDRGRRAGAAGAVASRQVCAERAGAEQTLRLHVREPPGLSATREPVTSQPPGVCLHTPEVGPEMRVEGTGMEREPAARWRVRGSPLLHISDGVKSAN